MRKCFIKLLITIVMIFFSGCSNMENSNETIDFSYLYTGFVGYEGPISEIPQDVLIFKDQESWNAFKEKYIRVIQFPYTNYKDSFDFNDEYLVYYQSFGARPYINTARKIDRMYIDHDQLIMDLEEIEDLYITVEYQEPQIYGYVILASIKKDSVPVSLANFYE